MIHHRIRKIRHHRRWLRLNGLQTFKRDERGVQLIEAAIVVPLLLIMFATVAEFGRYFYEYTTAAKGARLGARYLSSKSLGSSSTDYRALAKNIVVYGNTAGTGTPILPGLTTSNVTFEYAGPVPNVPDTVTVKIVNYKHQPVFDLGKLLNQPTLSTNVDVKPSVTMRYLLTAPSI